MPQLAGATTRPGGELSHPRPIPLVHDETGQATTEYAGLLALIAAVLLGAGMLVGVDVAAGVVQGIRTGICIVGGDVCRPSDAAAAGLEPCTMGDRSGGSGTT